MYQIIDENENKQQNTNITLDMLGIKPTNDFEQYAYDTIIEEVPEKVQEWKTKGGIGVMEAGQMLADEFDGNYNNVKTFEDQRNEFLYKHPNIEKRSMEIDERIARDKQKKLERDKRVNEGTASFLDRTGALLDRIGNDSYNAQLEHARENDKIARPHKDDKNYRYDVVGVNRAGQVIYDEIDLRKKIGFSEGLRNSISEGKALPLVSGWVEGKHASYIESISDKIKKGEQITEQELNAFNAERMKRYEKFVRGYSVGGNIGANWLPSMIAFGSEMALGGGVLSALGLAGKGIAVGNAVTKGLTNINKMGKAGEILAKGTGYTVGQLSEAGISTAVGGTIADTLGGRIYATYKERRLNDKVKITDKGVAVFAEAKESPAKAFLKSLEQCYISYFTEHLGGLIGAGFIKPVGWLAKKSVKNPATEKMLSVGATQFKNVMENCPKLEGFISKSTPILARAFEKLNNLPIKGRSADWLKSKVKFDGFLEELGEEVAEDILSITLGVNNEERSLENYVNAIVKTPEEWAILAGTIALQGGTLSIAGNMLGDAMQRKGATPEEIINVLANSTEEEKEELVDELIKENMINVRELTTEEKERSEEVKNDVYNKLVDAGIEDKEANNLAITAGTFFERYATGNEESRKVFDKFMNNLVVRYNIPAEETANVYFQKDDSEGKNIYNNFVNYHQKNNLIEPSPEKYEGESIDEICEYLGITEDKPAIIKTPKENVIINRKHIEKLVEQNESERKGFLNYIIRTLQEPNLIIKNGNKHKYIKLFNDNNKTKPHLQIVKVANDGSFYVTNFRPTKNQVNKEIKEGQIIFDLSNVQNENSSANNSINDSTQNFNPNKYNNGYKGYYQSANGKTFYQEIEEPDEDKLIAGYTYPQVMDKLQEIWSKIEDMNEGEPNFDKYMTYTHILEDAFEISMYPEKYPDSDKNNETMLNVYYIMNNQEIPEVYVETDKKSQRTYNELKELHEKKKEENEQKFRNYFEQDMKKKPVVTIMQNSDSSTALHEFGHLYLDLLNELANVNADAKEQLDAVNKWLGYSGEYTTAQHEKFANNFVAYLYKGKAPNAKLKTVFENFKEWLKSVYEQILDIPDVDISPEVQELFDNIFGADEFIEQKKQANELLKKVKKVADREVLEKIEVVEDKELTETQKRHKDVAYEILSVATGKSTRYLKSIFETDSTRKGLGKKRENVQELLDKVDDKITVSGGMRSHWLEFYSDTGVSYENDEIDGDYKLAEQAFMDIINKSWGKGSFSEYESQLSDQADYIAKAIDKADRQYKILLRSYKKENRNVALSAIYEWIDELDSNIKQDYEDRFIYDSGIIDRNKNVDKFDKAKREIIARAMELEESTYKTINDNEKYKEIVQQIIRSLDFLQPYDKAKLTANILDVPSTSMLMARIDSILDIAKTMEDVNLRRNLERDIHKELQGTKNVRKNGRSVGKYDYRTNKLFEELRQLDRLSPEQANEKRLESGKFATAEDNGLSYKDKLINKFLSYKAGGRTFSDTELMKSLYDEITKIKLAGKTAKSEVEMFDKLTEEKDIEELINIVQGKKKANFALKGYVNLLGNLESTLNAIFNKDIKERFGTEVLYSETQAQAFQHEQKQKFEREVARIYNLPQWNWDKKILEYLGEEYTYSEIRRKYDEQGEIVKTRLIDRTLTKMDIIQAYIWAKNDILEKRLINQFGDETLYAMFDELSSEDEKLAQLLMETAQSFYPLVNKAFIEKYGLDLPKVSCYFPSTPERGSEVDLYNDYSSKSLGNGFTKARANSETQAMDFHNPVATLYSHIDGVAKFCFMSPVLDKANLRFRDNDVKRAIVNKFGKDVYDTLEQNLINVTYKKEAPVFNGYQKVIDNLIGNWIQANVAIKPIVGLKQLLSANNYALDMPFTDWSIGFIKALAHPKQTIDYMMNIPYIKARFEGSYANEFLRQTIENSAFAKSKKLKDCCNLFIKTGDIGAIMFGGKPYVDYLINKRGMSEEQAIKQFIVSTNRSQQSSAVSSLSNFQVNMTRNPFGKLMIAYKNSPQQYIRMCGDAIVSTMNGDMSKTQCAKMLFNFGYLQPFLYTTATSGSLLRFAFTGDDDDLLKDLSTSLFNLGSDALPFLGDAYRFARDVFFYKNKRIPTTTPLLGDIQSEILKLSKDDISLEDYLMSLGYMIGHVGLGYNTKAVATMGAGVGDVFSGKPVKGALKVAGYTNKRAEHISGEK